jgi:putative spermidine/putrescine transport system ATP-binding protein
LPGFGAFATGRGDLVSGTPVDVLVRPEIIRLSKEGAGPDDVAFTIDEIVNYGDSFLIIGKSAGQELRARVPGLDMPTLARGERCSVSWPRERVHVVPR